MRRILLVIALILTLFAGCTEVECPLDNVVEMTCTLYDAQTQKQVKITDTLTVMATGTDSILFNRGINLNQLKLPLGYTTVIDTLLYRFSNAKGQAAVDTVFVRHENLPHFESVDCPVVVFHHISQVRWTCHSLSVMPLTIDSVALIQPTVNYEDTENLRVFLRSAAD